MNRSKLNKILMVFTEVIILLFLLVIFNFNVWAQNFNEADGRNARDIALGSSQGISKTNTLQALNPGIGTPQSELRIQESAKNLAIQSSKKQKSAEVSLASGTASSDGTGKSSLEPGRDATNIAITQSRENKTDQQIQTKVTRARQAGEEIRSQALSQKIVSTTDPKQLLLEAKLARKAEVKKQRDDYEKVIKTNYNRFQKIRYRDMHYNGMSFDYTAFNQLFTPIKKR
ncbi:MAG: hypothetical protein VX399_05520 [SAR324 cluster bacterium]|nr:hypothetical protein [SAR324 cluster bacterium]